MGFLDWMKDNVIYNDRGFDRKARSLDEVASPRMRDMRYQTTSTGEQLPETTANMIPNRRVAKDDWDYRAIQAEEAWENREANPEMAKQYNMMMANRLAKNFDPSSSEGVQALQTYLNRAGITDYEGKELKADAMFGQRTESALRKLQDMYERGNQGVSDYGFRNTPPPSNVATPVNQITGVEGYPNYPDFNEQNVNNFVESERNDPSSALYRYWEGIK